MNIGFIGPQRFCKTSGMVAFALSFHFAVKLPILANVFIQGSERLLTIEGVMNLRDAIYCFDEIYLSLDSRKFKENADFAAWVNQTRKKNLVVLWTAQSFGLVDKRIRDATDYLVLCSRHGNRAHMSVVDYHSMTLLRKYTLDNLQAIYPFYDHLEIASPLKA